MEAKTSLENHWALDAKAPYTSNKERNFEDTIVSNAIDAEIEKLIDVNDSGTEKNGEPGNSSSENASETLNFDLDSNIFSLIPHTNYKSYVNRTQRWMGHIISISGDAFTAKLEDINSPGTFEVGDFELREVPEADKTLIKLGAAFYWSVGYSYLNGTVAKTSTIRFQRLANWTTSEYDEAADRANELFKKLKWK